MQDLGIHFIGIGQFVHAQRKISGITPPSHLAKKRDERAEKCEKSHKKTVKMVHTVKTLGDYHFWEHYSNSFRA